MRNYLLIFFLFVFAGAQAQVTNAFEENFESLPLSMSSSGNSNWARTQTLAVSGVYADSASLVSMGDSAILTSSSFSTSGKSAVMLSFDHICKIEYFDRGYIQISTNNGTTWTSLQGSQYLGNGQFTNTGNAFSSVSYPLSWLPANNNAIPTSSWWQHEIFDISSIAANSSSVMVRFLLVDVNSSGGMGNYGWLLDNVKVLASPSELIPPTITLLPTILKDTIYGTGPFDIWAEIKDSSSVSAAYVFYTINNSTDSVVMSAQGNDKFMGSIPQQVYGTPVSYYVKAIDSSSNSNESMSLTYSFYNKKQPKIVSIGTGTATTYYAPMYNYTTTSPNVYSHHVSMYDASEFGGNYGIIEKISWFKANAVNYTGTASMEIYVKATSSTTLPTNDSLYQVELAGATLVYKDTALVLPAMAQKIDFTTNQNSFMYDGSSNLMVFVKWHRNGNLSANYLRWNYTYTSGKAITFKGSTANPTSTSGSGYRPNISFTLVDPSVNYDAGVYSVESPAPVSLTTSALPIQIRFLNYGNQVLTKVKIDYELDGVSQNQQQWTGSVASVFKSNPITLGSHTFNYGPHHIKAWTSMPNDSADQFTYNDTLEYDFYACNSILSGSYTIGGSGADFSNFSSALTALKYCGVNGPVTFYINSGIYTETLVFTDSMPGVDSVNTVSFRSATGNANDVVIKSNDEKVVSFLAAHNISFRNITIDASQATNKIGVYFDNEAQHIQLDSCNINSQITNSYSVNAIYAYHGGNDYIKISNSTIKGGYRGIYFYSNSNKYGSYNEFTHNMVSDFYREGINLYYEKNCKVNYNNIEKLYDINGSTTTSINMYHGDNFEIIGNNSYLEPKASSYGIYIYYATNAVGQNLIANNISINNSNSTSSSYRALYVNYSSKCNFYNNTFVNYGGSGTSEAVYVNGSSSSTSALVFKNNIMANYAGAYAFEKYNTTPIASMDYNLYYTTGGQIMKFGSIVVAKAGGISAVQTATGMDTNSILGTPKFYSHSNGHSFSADANGAAMPLAQVINDIDMDLRDATTPDIGADEYTLSSIDVGITSILNPILVDTEARNTDVKAILTNFGTDTITAVNVNYILNSNNPVSYAWTGSLYPGSSDTVTIPNFVVPALQSSLKVYSVLTGDTLTFNDTIGIQFQGLLLKEAELQSLDNPTDGCGKGTSEQVSITIKNNGVGSIASGLTASFSVNGGSPVTEAISTAIAPGASISYTFTATVNMLVAANDSTFNIKAWVSHASDLVKMNDTVNGAVVSKAYLTAPVVSDTTINYGTSVTLSATAADPMQWFANDTTTNVLASGSTYTTPLLFDTTTYYVRANTNIPPQNVQVGTASTTFGMWDYPPYGGGMGAGKYQILYTAADLQAAGLSAGNIESIAFHLATGTATISTFDIYMASTNISSLTTNFVATGLTQVFQGSLSATAGWNTHTFSTPFPWDGTSNIIVQVCANGIGYTAPPQSYTATSYNSLLSLAGIGTQCSSASGTTSNKRPNIKFVTASALGCSSPRVAVNVNVPLPDYDAKVEAIVSPESNCGIASAPVVVDIVNKGVLTIPSGFSMTYKINGGSYITPEVVNDSILMGDTLRYTFTTLASLPSGANGTSYVITAKVLLSNDGYSPNDSLMSDSIFSKYTPAMPVVSNTSVTYGSSASLTATATDSLYWYLDSNLTNFVGTGNPYQTMPLYDTTKYWVVAQKTLPYSNYNVGTGTSVSGYSDPSPYGSGQYGAKQQYLIRASELLAMGMMQGYIDTISFDNVNVKGNALADYSISMGLTQADDLSGAYMIGNLTTVYTNPGFVDVFGWNAHTLSTPFYWDGVSNIVIQTLFKNITSTPLSGVHYTTTSFQSAAWIRGYSTFDPQDTTIQSRFTKRPNIRFSEIGYGYCKSDVANMQVAVSNFPAYDAGLLGFVNPVQSASSIVSTPIKVILKNFGQNAMTSASIQWSENGQNQTAYSWTGNLLHGEVDTVTIASHNFMGGITSLNAWVSLSNDNFATNDSISSTINVCMSGSYSIGANGNNFATIGQAINNLEACGICGPVTLNIDSGLYTQALVINPITGASTTNTVTFQSTDLDSTKVTIMVSTSQSSNYVIKMKGASYINFNKIGITANGSNYSNVMVFEDSTHHIDIKNCILTSGFVTSGTASNIYAYHHNVSNLNIENNVLNNGYRSIYLYGSSSDKNHNIHIVNNDFNSFGYYASYMYYTINVEISNNLIISGNTSNSYYGLYGQYLEGDIQVLNNRIDLSPVNNAYGIYVRAKGTASQRALIANNTVAIQSGSSSNYGLYVYYNEYSDVVFNSVYLGSGGTSSRALYLYNGSNVKVLNNNIYSKAGYGLYVSSPNALTSFDYNNIYVDALSTLKFAYWGGGNVADLANLKLQDVTKNIHTVSIDPMYVSSSDLHAQQISIYNAGIPAAGVTTDMDGESRSATAPSIGADEFTPSAIDLGLNSMPYPAQSDCGYSSSDSVIISMKNFGLNAINFANTNATITVTVSGINPDTLVLVLNSGTLNSGADTDLVISNNYDLSMNGTYTFNAVVNIANDGSAVNNAINTVDIMSYPSISSFPFVMNFESGNNITLKTGKGSDADVSVDGISANTGLFGLHFQGGTYNNWYTPSNVVTAYTNTDHIASAATCNVDATQLNALSMKFDLKQTAYSSYYLTKNSWFRVMLTDANGTYYLKTINGDSVFQPATINSDPFTTHVFNLDNWAGQQFSISMEAVNKYSYGYGSYDGDNAFVDNLTIWSPSNTDIGVNAILMDDQFGPVGSSKVIKVAVENFGTDTITSIPLGFNINNGLIYRDTFTTVLTPSHLDTFTFVQTAGLTSGNQLIKVFAELNGDAVVNNDTASISVKGLNTINLDYVDNFDGADQWFGTGSLNQWELGTPSTQYINGAHSGSNAWATRLNSNYLASATEYLYSPYFNIPSTSDTAELSFFHFMRLPTGNAMGYLQYSINGGVWAILGYMGDPASTNWYNYASNGLHVWSNTSAQWVYSSIKLDPSTFNTGTNFQFRFVFISGNSTSTDEGWAIDDFSIVVPALANDAGISAITAPSANVQAGDSLWVSVDVHNFGTDTLYNIPVSYDFNGNTTTDTWTGTLLPDSSAQFTFSSKLFVPMSGSFTLCAKTNLLNDGKASNDETCATLQAASAGVDGGISRIVSPSGQTSIFDSISVSVMIQNYGSDTLYSIPLGYTAAVSFANETWTGSLNPGDSVMYTFNHKYIAPIGVYTLCAETQIINDVVVGNNSSCENIVGSSIFEMASNGFALGQNEPNPANGITRIPYTLPMHGQVKFSLYHVGGKKLDESIIENAAGSHWIQVNTKTLQPGVYYYTMEFEGVRISKRMIVL